MSTAHQSEQDDSSRLQKALKFLDHCRNRETEARARLSDATRDTKRAKEKYETLFEECEKRAVARRKSGQIIVNPSY